MVASANDPVSANVLNVPNAVTTIRLLLSLVVFVVIPLQFYLAAFIIFLITVSTDWLDGYWARRFNQVTQVGRILDPFADKIIICGTFIFLAAEPESGIAAWVAVVVMGREMLVTVLRGFFEQRGIDFSASFAGKVKMVVQCTAAAASLLTLHYAATGPADWLLTLRDVSVWLAVMATVYSGAGYVLTAARLLRAGRG